MKSGKLQGFFLKKLKPNAGSINKNKAQKHIKSCLNAFTRRNIDYKCLRSININNNSYIHHMIQPKQSTGIIWRGLSGAFLKSSVYYFTYFLVQESTRQFKQKALRDLRSVKDSTKEKTSTTKSTIVKRIVIVFLVIK